MEDGSDTSSVNELRYHIPDNLVEEPLSQEIERGDEDKPLTPKDGGQSKVKNVPSPNVKTYPKRTTRSKPPQYYGWSLNSSKAVWI